MAVEADPDGVEPGEAGSPVSGRIIAIVIVVAVVVAAVAGWVWFDIRSVRPLPGEPLVIRTDPAPAAGAVCAKDVLPPAKFLVVGDELTLIAANGGADIPTVWPNGYAARLNQGRGELYDPIGYLVAAEGQTIQERFFGASAADGAFHVCRVARD